MSVKTIKMVRKIRDKHFKETRGLSLHEQIRFIREKSDALRKAIKKNEPSTTEKRGVNARK
jgi:hypothetical protein